MSQTDRDLLAIEAATIYALSDSGRILHTSSPDRKEGPRLHLAICASGSIVRLRHDVGEDTARAIEDLAAREPSRWHPDGAPAHLSEYRRLLAVETPIEQNDTGRIWTFPDRLDYDHPAVLVSSDTPAGDQLVARLTERGMPEPLFDLGFVDIGEFWAPWCVALHGEEIAAIAFTVGLGPAGAEVGVATMPALRGRGFAAAATAGWASLAAHRDRALFYGARRANVSSHRVTERLGLRLIGTGLTIT